MSVVVVGLNHKTSPIGLLERLSIPPGEQAKAIHALLAYERVGEGAVLSTCNRVELYATVTKFHGGAQDLRNFLAEFCHVAPEDFSDHIYTYFDEGAIGHLFRVAAGIDSLVIGESEILGQVRRALQTAETEGSVRRTLRRAFTQALHVGKRARSETSISRNPVSVSSAAVELARRAFPEQSLEGKRVAIVGAGEMGRLAVQALEAAGAAQTTLLNRTEERAREVAEAFSITPRPLSELSDVLGRVDIVICSTTSTSVVVDVPTVRKAVATRSGADPLFIVDIAVPRDVDPPVSALDGVVLRDIDDLRALVDTNLGGRLGEVSKVEDIIAEEIAGFSRWERSIEIDPAIAQLVDRSERIRSSELERLRSRLRDLDDSQWKALDQVTRRIVNKLLHAPLHRSRELSSSSAGHIYVEALHELFDLDDDPS
jgi:glutamyl-tRNA reductase